jgi:hypothetical protein
MEIATFGGETDRQTRTGSRRTAENKQEFQRITEHNTLSNGSTLSLAQPTTDAYKTPQTNTQLHVQFNTTVSCRYWTQIGSWVHLTSNGEVNPRKHYVLRQFNLTRRHTQNLHDSMHTDCHSHRSTSTVQHKHTATAGLLRYTILQRRETQWSTAATQLSSCANRTNSRHNETDTAIRANDRKEKNIAARH